MMAGPRPGSLPHARGVAMIVSIPDLLSAGDVRHCHVLLATAAWQDGRATAGALAAQVKDNQQLAQGDPVEAEIGALILQRLSANPQFIASALPLRVLPPRINRYSGNGAYGDHIDKAIFGVPGTPFRIRGDLSVTVFLSNPDSYDGGGLIIAGEAGEHRVRLPAGHMVLYPGGRLHRVEPVTRGVRLASFFWVQSLVREPVRRAILVDLDQSIQTLGGAMPDHPVTGRLTGIYHNLLREWSVT
jgi:PKHD-type hydroxylase